MAKEYYRLRITLDPTEEAEQECMDYLQSFNGRLTDAGKELLLLGLDIKKGAVTHSDQDAEEKKRMNKEILELRVKLSQKEKSIKGLSATLTEKNQKLLEYKTLVNELKSEDGDSPTYDAIIAKPVRVENVSGSDDTNGKKTGKKTKVNAPEIIRYESTEKSVEDYASLVVYYMGISKRRILWKLLIIRSKRDG